MVNRDKIWRSEAQSSGEARAQCTLYVAGRDITRSDQSPPNGFSHKSSKMSSLPRALGLTLCSALLGILQLIWNFVSETKSWNWRTFGDFLMRLKKELISICQCTFGYKRNLNQLALFYSFCITECLSFLPIHSVMYYSVCGQVFFKPGKTFFTHFTFVYSWT